MRAAGRWRVYFESHESKTQFNVKKLKIQSMCWSLIGTVAPMDVTETWTSPPQVVQPHTGT